MIDNNQTASPAPREFGGSPLDGRYTFGGQLRASAVALLLLTVITGLLYPAVVTAAAKVLFPRQAGGSLITTGDKAIGSSLIGQQFDDPAYFWSRLSATGPVPYTGFNADKLTGSSGSNLGPTNSALTDAVKARIDALKAADPTAGDRPVPVDLVTASGSGLDPHISPAAAEYQVPRVAKARGMSQDAVRALVEKQTEGRQLGILGEKRVNVLELNLELGPPPTTRPAHGA
jgi:K+-transporting ATPase ATPase C chain